MDAPTLPPNNAPHPWLPSWAVWVAERPWAFYPLLVALAVLLYWPGQMQVPPLDRDEPRFAQASKQMKLEPLSLLKAPLGKPRGEKK